MKFEVYGIQRNVKWEYQGKSGINHRLHCLMSDPLSSDDSEGFRVEQIKVPSRVDVSDIHPGDTVEVYYNRFGSVDQVFKV